MASSVFFLAGCEIPCSSEWNNLDPVKPRPVALPYPRHKIESGEIRADGLISINLSKDPRVHDSIPKENFGEILFLYFDDVPFESLARAGERFKGPKVSDVKKSLAFAKRIGKTCQAEAPQIAVHCQAGKSRSAAIALAINASMNPGHCEETVAALLACDPEQQMCFNPRIIAIADELLQPHMGLDRALMKLCSPYRSWKRYWDF